MLHPRFFMKASMADAEKSKETGHLMMFGKFPAPYNARSYPDRLDMCCGETTHPAFEIVQDYFQCYRLKPGYSASEALRGLLDDHYTVVDCGLVMVLSYYLSILKSMQALHGKKEGADRFDSFFGSSEKEIPLERRLLLSPEGPIMGTHRKLIAPHLNLPYPLQPLSFVLEIRDVQNKEALLSKVNIGSMIIFAGDKDYLCVHRMGTEGAFNCAVSALNPLKVVTFDQEAELTEENLFEIHEKSYSEKPSEEEIAYFDGAPLAFYNQKPNADRKNMQGLVPYYFEFKEEALTFLLEAPLEELEKGFESYVAEESLRINEVLLKRDLLPLENKLKVLTLSSSARPLDPPQSYTPLKEQAPTQSSRTPEKENQIYLGLKRGFLN